MAGIRGTFMANLSFRLRPLALALLAAVAALAPAQLISAVKTNSITKAAQDYMKANKIKGMCVVAGRNGTIVYTRGFGDAREGFLTTPPVKANGDTVFRLASISKSVTAIVAMKLVEEGKLDISKNTRHYFGSLPNHHTHKVRHILSHMSGIRHYNASDIGAVISGQYNSMQSASQLFWNDALLFAPGKKSGYSTHAYTVLGAVMEIATGKQYRDLIQDRLNAAHGISTLKVEDRSKANSKRSDIFEVIGGIIVRMPVADNTSWKSPGGGLEASGNDLCRLGMKLLRNQILTKATKDRMFVRESLNDGTVTDYALGWPMSRHLGQWVASHTGRQPGAENVWRLYLESGLVVVVLSNTVGHSPNTLARSVADIVL